MDRSAQQARQPQPGMSAAACQIDCVFYKASFSESGVRQLLYFS